LGERISPGFPPPLAGWEEQGAEATVEGGKGIPLKERGGSRVTRCRVRVPPGLLQWKDVLDRERWV